MKVKGYSSDDPSCYSDIHVIVPAETDFKTVIPKLPAPLHESKSFRAFSFELDGSDRIGTDDDDKIKADIAKQGYHLGRSKTTVTTKSGRDR